jgi:hypothetical protein
LAATITLLISYREAFIAGIFSKDTSNNKGYTESIMFATALCEGIGYVIIGNLYDNVSLPKRTTFILLLILAVLTIFVRLPLHRQHLAWNGLYCRLSRNKKRYPWRCPQ